MSSGSQTRIEHKKTNFTELLATAGDLVPEMLAEAAATDRTDGFPAKTFENLKRGGLLKAVLPAKFGGADLGLENDSTAALLALLKTFGSGNLVVGRIYEGHFNAVQLINEYADENKAARILTEAARGNHLFGVWNTEAGDGVKIEPLENGNFRLEGAKTFASGIGYVNRPLITGRMPDGGWQMLLLRLDELKTKTDDSWWKPLGMRATRSYRIDFSGVEISREQLIGGADDYYREPFFSGGAIRFAAVQLGAAELLLEMTGSFLRELNRASDAFQQMRIGEMAIAIEGGNALLRNAAHLFDEYLADKNPARLAEVLHYAGMSRTAVERACTETIERVARSVGSRGLLQTYHFERVIRDLTMYLRQAAPDATLTGIGKYLLEKDSGIDRHKII